MNKIKLLLMLLLVSVFTAQAQVTPSTLTLYDGTTQNGCVPICGAIAYTYQRIQYVMPTEDLTALVGKTLNGMTFYYTSDQQTPVMDGVAVEVYMKPYANDFLGTAFISMDDATMVYEGELTLEEGEMSFEFTELYDYWEGNILVEFRIVEPGESQTPALVFKGVDKRDASIFANHYSGVEYMSYGAKQNFLPKTTISYEQSTFFEITATADPEGAATFTGAGFYREGAECTLTAKANLGYGFVNWTLNGNVVSTDPSITFEVEGDADYVANFTEMVIIPGTITVYEGATKNNRMPLFIYYYDAFTKCQYVIPASDLAEMSGNEITQLKYYFDKNQYRDQSYSTQYAYPWTTDVMVDIYMTEVNYTTISSYVDKSSAQSVYTGYITCEANGEATIVLDTPYQYNGGNLLIGVENQSKGDYNNVYCYGQTISGASICGYTYGNNPSSISVSQQSFIPQTTFTYLKAGYPAEVTAVVEPEGAGTVTGAGTLLIGDQTTLTATAATGYVFDKWTNEDDELVSDEASFIYDVIGDTTFIANFVLDTFDIAVYAYYGGTVEGAGSFAYGTQHTITATADTVSHYHFVNWTDGNNVIVSTDAAYTFTVECNADFFAHFSVNDYEVTAVTNPEGKGTITGAGTYAYQQWATLTVEPNIDYRFVNWTSGETALTDATIDFQVESDIAFVANLEKYLTLVTLDINGDDDAEVTGAGAYEPGTEVTVTATPSSYFYYFINWTSGNEVVSIDPQYTFEVGEDDVELIANFGSHLVNGAVVTVHDGESQNSYIPMYGYYADVVQENQMIYPATDLEDLVGKTIRELAFYFDYGQYYSYGSGVGNWIISLGETEATELDGLDETTELTQVFEGGLDAKFNHQTKQLTITFDTPYLYNGGNLLVDFNHPVAGSYKDYVFYGEEVTGASYAQGYVSGQMNFLPKTTFTCYDIEPIVTVDPERVEFPGFRPNNAWMEDDENYYVAITNMGDETEITDITITNSYFSYVLPEGVELPLTLENGEWINVQVLRGEGVGVQTGDMAIAYGENQECHVALKATAYDPEDGDVWENAIVVEFDDNNEYENQMAVDGLKYNYNLYYNDETMVDAVYKVTLETEAVLEAGSTATNSVVRFYTEDFQEVGGPSYTNSYWYNGPKYVGNRGNRDENDYINEKFDGDEMPEDWWVSAEGMNTWTLNTEDHYVKCSHNINAGQTLQGKTYLITPVMDMSNETNVIVNLKYMNKQWDNDVDFFEVAYRNYGGSWITIESIEEAHETWTELALTLTSDNVYFTDSFQLGFVMDDHYGYGVLIDEVLVKGIPQPEYNLSQYCPAGTYYVVVSTNDDDFQQVNIRLSDPMVPEMAGIYYPYNEEGVALDASISLELGWYTEEMQVLFGITNPPTDTLVAWTDQLRNEIPFTDLEYNKKYYYQVNERNISGVTEGEIVHFTTVREGVENFLVDKTQVYYGLNDTLTFTWDAKEGALGYKLFYGYYDENSGYEYWYGQFGEVITGTTYELPVDYLWSNMDGIAFMVKAVYKYGDSERSNIEKVYVSGYANYVYGYVYEIDYATPIAGATVELTCIDEFDIEHTYVLTTDVDGLFEYYTNVEEENVLYAGAYTMAVAKEGYQTYTEEFNLWVYGYYDNAIALTENYNPVTNVVATIVEANDKMNPTDVVEVTWELEGYTPPTPPTPPAPSGDVVYTLVTDVNDLNDGDMVLIVYNDNLAPMAMGWQSNATTRAAIAIEVVNDSIINPTIAETSDDNENPFVFMLEDWGDGWAFIDPLYGDEGGYLTATNANAVATVIPDNMTEKAIWNLDGMDANGNVRPEAVDGGRMLQYNAGNVMFRCYANTGQQPISLFKLEDSSKGNRSCQNFNVYRTSAYNHGPYTEDNTELLATGVTELTYTDETWADITVGTYKYGVTAVYGGNRGNRSGQKEYLLYEGFDSGLPTNWNTIDADGDGYNWYLSSEAAYNSSYGMTSASYDSDALFPDNYLVTPQLSIVDGTMLHFWACAQDKLWAAEHFGVAISTESNYNPYDFTTIQEWTMTAKGGDKGPRGTQELGNWYEYTVDLSAYAGQDIYVAIRHFNCTDWFRLNVDEVEVYYMVYPPITGNNESEIVWSEPLDVNMEIENGVDISVDLNNGESPEGIQVTLTNTGNDEVYTVTLDETGYYAWETFRKGDYRVQISLNGDYSTVDEVVSIWDPTNIEYTLNYIVEMIISVTAVPEGAANTLYVDRNGFTTLATHFFYGETAIIYANPKDGYEFKFWMNNDTLFTNANYYAFTVTNPGEYVAYFSATNSNYYVVENPMQYSDNMSFIGAIAIEGEIQDNLDLELGAFAGDECRGGARLQYYPQVGKFLVFLTVYGNEAGEEITFHLYNHTIGQESTFRCATKEAFEAEAVFGTTAEPYVFNFRNTVLQNVEFAGGWNWMSTYIEQSTFDGLAAIEAGLDTVGVRIVSQSNGFVEYDAEYDEWSGTLTAINNEEMFKVNTTADVTFEMEGYQAAPAAHEITLYNGWTYLGFISMEPMSLETALADLEPSDGDMIKAQEGFATYDAEYDEWSGSLNTLNPGLGFMYKSNNEDEVTFTYPTVNRGETKANVTSEHWMANVHAYPNNMTVVAVVELNDTELIGGDYELAAFVDGEVRGSVKLINAGTQGRYYAFLTVAGNEAANISFGLYDAETGLETTDCDVRLNYNNNAMIGSMSEPYVISFRGTTGMDELNGGVAMYPNPAEKSGYVKVVMAESHARIEIINSIGQVVSEQTTTQMPASIQAPEEAGVYTVRIITEGKNIKCQKLIVK